MMTKLPVVASVLVATLMLLAGVAYSSVTNANASNASAANLTLIITSLSESSSTHGYTQLTGLSGLSTSSVAFNVGPFAPG